MSGEVWYFAYCSNLDPEQMKKRIGSWEDSRKLVLKTYRLVFNHYSSKWKGYTANILRTGKEEDQVYGVLYLIRKEQLDILTKYEGVNPVFLPEIRAYTYVFGSREPSKKPPENYLERIINGLRYHGYGDDVIESVKRIAGLSSKRNIDGWSDG